MTFTSPAATSRSSPRLRRSRGHQTDDKFDYGGSPLLRGHRSRLPASRSRTTRAFTAVELDDDIFYLREDLVFAFEATLRWENGNVPGLRGRLPVVQFRGDGAVALRSDEAARARQAAGAGRRVRRRRRGSLAGSVA